eukprot:5642780-Prymnesium_polylepis.1
MRRAVCLRHAAVRCAQRPRLVCHARPLPFGYHDARGRVCEARARTGAAHRDSLIALCAREQTLGTRGL